MWQSLLLSTADPSHTFAPDNSELRHIHGPCRAPVRGLQRHWPWCAWGSGTRRV